MPVAGLPKKSGKKNVVGDLTTEDKFCSAVFSANPVPIDVFPIGALKVTLPGKVTLLLAVMVSVPCPGVEVPPEAKIRASKSLLSPEDRKSINGVFDTEVLPISRSAVGAEKTVSWLENVCAAPHVFAPLNRGTFVPLIPMF